MDPRADELRGRVAAHLERLHELTLHRNGLLHRAGSGAEPGVVRALRANRQLADSVRAAARRARVQLAQLETAGSLAADIRNVDTRARRNGLDPGAGAPCPDVRDG